MDRDGGSSPIDKHPFARLVLLPQDYVLFSAPSLVQLTETAIAIAARVRLLVLLPEQL